MVGNTGLPGLLAANGQKGLMACRDADASRTWHTLATARGLAHALAALAAQQTGSLQLQAASCSCDTAAKAANGFTAAGSRSACESRGHACSAVTLGHPWLRHGIKRVPQVRTVLPANPLRTGLPTRAGRRALGLQRLPAPATAQQALPLFQTPTQLAGCPAWRVMDSLGQLGHFGSALGTKERPVC